MGTKSTKTYLELVEDSPVVEVSVGEDSINSTADRPELRNGRIFDVDPAREILVAVEQARGSVQGVARVVDRRALFRRLVSRTQEDPLLGRSHLTARLGGTLPLQANGEPVQFHAELAEVLVLPNAFVDVLRRLENFFNVRRVGLDSLLNVLLNGESAVHFFVRFEGPSTPFLEFDCQGHR